MKRKSLLRIALVFILAFVVMIGFSTVSNVYAADEAVETVEEAEEAEGNTLGIKAIAASVVVGLGVVTGALSMGRAISKSTEAMSRQPEASDKINSAMMLGLVFIETAIIYALIIAILIIFVL